ncbi:sporulation protein [Streptomyces sp. NPDC020917]|uniref:sporulation protein n=1 Tax=Streptomyces sp. NPDC020917 TaxID=3365102 RepID=UPI0037B9F3AE
MKRRNFLSGCTAATAATASGAAAAARPPAARAHEPGTSPGGPDFPAGTARLGARVGRREVAELRRAARDARRADSRSGGGSAPARSAARLLVSTAAPLLGGSCTPAVERELYSATAELARLAGWAAFDTGRHDLARGYFRQALHLAGAGGDTQLTAYVLACMSLQATLTGRPGEAVDLAAAAARTGAHSPRLRGFAHLVQARAHARDRAPRAAGACLAGAEVLLESAEARGSQDDPEWLDFFTRPRLAADAAEIHRDLGNPRGCFRWHAEADAMAPGDFTRSVGMRLSVVATAHLQAGDLDRALALGRRSADMLQDVASHRAHGYLGAFTASLGPWRREPAVRAFTANLHPDAAGGGRRTS